MDQVQKEIKQKTQNLLKDNNQITSNTAINKSPENEATSEQKQIKKSSMVAISQDHLIVDPDVLKFRTASWVGVRAGSDQVNLRDIEYEVDNSFLKMDFFVDGSLGYDKLTTVGLRYSALMRKYVNGSSYRLPLDYIYSLGMEKYFDSFPISFFAKIYYENYSFVFIPQFGLGLQQGTSKFLWLGGGVMTDFINPLRFNLFGIDFMKVLRIQLEFGNSMKTSTEYQAKLTYGEMTGSFIRLNFFSNLFSDIYLGGFWEQFSFKGQKNQFVIESTNIGVVLAYAI